MTALHKKQGTRRIAPLGLGLGLAALTLLGACSREAPPAPASASASAPVAGVAHAPAAPAASPSAAAPDPSVAALAPYMQAVFANYDKASGSALAQLPDSDNPEASAWFRVAGVGSKTMPNGDIVLVTSASPSNDHGADLAGHPTPGSLSVYFLTPRGQNWTLLQRHENIAQLGSFGTFPEPEWVELGPGKPGFLIRHGGTWMGQTIILLGLFDLTMSPMRDLAGMPQYSGNGNCDDDYADCWEVDGKFSFVPGTAGAGAGAGYHELVFEFEGYLEQPQDKTSPDTARPPRPRPDATTLGKARYVYDGTAYKLVEGKNLVPQV